MTQLEDKIRNATAAISAISSGIELALQINDDRDGGSDPAMAASALDSKCEAARELLRYALAVDEGDGYPADNPVSRLEALQAELDNAKTQDERDEILGRISRLRNGVTT